MNAILIFTMYTPVDHNEVIVYIDHIATSCCGEP